MAALVKSLGRTVVLTPGTKVALTMPAGILPGTAHALIIEALPTNVGKVYVGESTLVRATFVGVIVVLPIPTANSIPTFSMAVTQAANAIRVTDFYIDADTANDGVVCSIIVA